MIFNMTLYGLKSSRAYFRSKIAVVLHELNYSLKKADSDVWDQEITNLDVTK